MELLQNLKRKKMDNGRYESQGLFLCPYCKKKVQKQLSSGKVQKSCGCMRGRLVSEKRTIHGESQSAYHKASRLYRIWVLMLDRCKNKERDNYKYYGGKGIKVCKEWSNYVIFRAWAVASGYQENLTIDRKKGDRNYTPGNCRWVTHAENCRNNSHTKLNWDNVWAIRYLGQNARTIQKKIGIIFGVSSSTIGLILRNKIWEIQ